jgi:alkylglycerol monooxygenase
MEAYANALLIAIPSFMVLLITEIAYGQWSGKQTYVFMDTIASLSSGLTNILKDTL